jgi:tellurium resistance protein TerZ
MDRRAVNANVTACRGCPCLGKRLQALEVEIPDDRENRRAADIVDMMLHGKITHLAARKPAGGNRMQTGGSVGANQKGGKTVLREIVMGLHWDPPQPGDSAPPADLDALCILHGHRGEIVDVISPDHPRTDNDSVVHTGNSRNGSSSWDDERIFVFLDALPPVISALTFVVLDTRGRGFAELQGAFCHLSDRVTERELTRLALRPLATNSTQAIASIERGSTGWRLDARRLDLQSDVHERVRDLLGRSRTAKPRH